MRSLSWASIENELFRINAKRWQIAYSNKSALSGRLEDDLLSLREKIFEKTEQVPSITGIKNLFHAERRPKLIRGRMLRFIISYLDQAESSDFGHTIDLDRYDQLKARLQKSSEAFLAERKGDEFLFKSNLFESLFSAVVESQEEEQVFCSSIFNFKDRRELTYYRNTAYFVCFRYSTVAQMIVKTFLAVLSPGDNKLGFTSFVHILEGRQDATKNQYNVRKVTKGPVIHLQSASYLIGRTIRDDAVHVNNLEIIALERDNLLARNPIIDTLIMSSAAVNQPIVSRMAMIRVGDRAAIGQKLSDRLFVPKEFPSSELKKVLYAELDIFNELGLLNHVKIPLSSYKREILSELVKRINNLPRIDTIKLGQNLSKSSSSGQGAIEVWGDLPRA